MPAGKRHQSNAMLYTVITFVGLFVAATTVAVVYYVKAEDYRQRSDSLTAEIDQLATPAQRRQIGALVGSQQAKTSRLGEMVGYLDRVVSLVTGGLAEPTSAEVKVDTALLEVEKTLSTLKKDWPDLALGDPNTAGLVPLLNKLKAVLDDTAAQAAELEKSLAELHTRFDDAVAEANAKEKTLLEEREKYASQVNSIKADYDDLKQRMDKTTGDQVQFLEGRLNEEKAEFRETRQKLLKTGAELKVAQSRIDRLQTEVAMTKPPPDSYVTAFKPDGKVILIDQQADVVHLDLGSDDRIYRGLMFSVYDRNAPIPRDGRGKAEVEVFDVGKNFCGARIVRSDKKSPIVLNDIVANLIWDSRDSNVFVLAGDFDLNGDGHADADATEKLTSLIERWGGTIAGELSAETDFLLLGTTPAVPPKPTFDDLELDPTAEEKYNSAAARLAQYQGIQDLADKLSIPIFNLDRFLDMVGSATQARRPGFYQ